MWTKSGLEMKCKICKDKGFIITVDDQLNESITICECKQEEVIAKNLKKAGLLKYSENKNFKDYNVTEEWQRHAKRICVDYARNPKGWLTILGQSRTGKTHLGLATMKNIVANNVGKHFTSHYEMWGDLRNKIDYGKLPQELYRDLINVDILYIDDFLKRNKLSEITPNEDKLAFDIINARYSRDKLTIITSEWLMEDLYNHHVAIAGRVDEASGKNLVQIGKKLDRMYHMKDKK